MSEKWNPALAEGTPSWWSICRSNCPMRRIMPRESWSWEAHLEAEREAANQLVQQITNLEHVEDRVRGGADTVDGARRVRNTPR